MKPILVSGSLAYDRIMNFPGLFKDHFLADALHNINVSFLVKPPSEQYGGCAGNIAYSLALLGGAPEIVESAGCDFTKFEEWLTTNGVSTDTVQVLPDVTTASAYIITDEADNQICAFSEGASARTYEKEIEVDKYTLAILGTTSIENALHVMRACRAGALPYLFDPSQKLTAYSAEELKECIESAKGLLVNDYELKMITEKTGWSEKDIVSKVEFLVVTLGASGSRIVSKDAEETVPALKVEKPIDPTGAGDAYRAGFIRGLTAELPLKTCAKIGSAVAAYAVEWYGTQNHRFTMSELKARYESTYKEPLPL